MMLLDRSGIELIFVMDILMILVDVVIVGGGFVGLFVVVVLVWVGYCIVFIEKCVMVLDEFCVEKISGY